MPRLHTRTCGRHLSLRTSEQAGTAANYHQQEDYASRPTSTRCQDVRPQRVSSSSCARLRNALLLLGAAALKVLLRRAGALLATPLGGSDKSAHVGDVRLRVRLPRLVEDGGAIRAAAGAIPLRGLRPVERAGAFFVMPVEKRAGLTPFFLPIALQSIEKHIGEQKMIQNEAGRGCQWMVV